MNERKDFLSSIGRGVSKFSTEQISDFEAPRLPLECANDGVMAFAPIDARADELGGNDEEFFHLRRLAESLYKRRTSRARFFDDGMLGEPAWDMLLALYSAEVTDVANTVGQIATYSRVPLTTALRWIEYLEAEELIDRWSHDTDRRGQVLKLTTNGRARLDSYFRTISL